MNKPSKIFVWHHVEELKTQLENKFIEQEIHLAQQARQTWF